MTPEFDVVVVVYKGPGSIFSWGEDDRVTNIRNDWHNTRNCIVAPNYREVDPCDNIGWIKAANAGMALSTAPYVVLMNDDCTVETDNWLELLREPMLADERIACVGPVTNGQYIQNDMVRGFPRRPHVVSGWCDLTGERLTTPLSFFCVMFRREAWVDVGYLDERFGIGLAEDDDWQIRADQKGWKVAIQPKVFVRHEGGSSWESQEQRDALQKKNQALLRKKWRHLLP